MTALWVPATHRAFPAGDPDLRTRQRDVAFRIQQLNFVRNRAAHHEPIHTRDLSRDMQFAMDLAGWISPSAKSWVDATSSLPSIISSKPQHANVPGRSRAGNSVETSENQPSPTSTTSAESRGNRAPTGTSEPVSHN